MPHRQPLCLTRTARAGLIAVAVLGVSLTGCATLSFVKPRLAPPTPASDGSVMFHFYAPYATVVQVGGDWEDNRWLAGNAQIAGTRVGAMEGPDKGGTWSLTVKLPPGRHQYKFHIDNNTWKDDPNNPERVDDGFGGFNSLVVVK